MTTQDGPLRVVSADELVGGAPASPSPGTPAPPRQPITIRLTYPIQAHGETVSSLTIRPPKAGDMIRAYQGRNGQDATRLEAVANLLVSCCDIPRSSVDAIDPYDFGVLSKAIDPFFSKPGADS